jgi:membrane fusion protein (multidrug efflux system)
MEVARPRNRSRRVLWWSALGVIVIAGSLTAMFVARNADGKGSRTANAASGGARKTGAKAKEASPAAPVELSQVRRGGIDTWLETTATLEARNSALLVARRQGQVLKLLAEEGQWVGKGATLAQLDDTEARLAVERAELALDVTTREQERATRMQSEGYLSPKDWDDVQQRLRNAKLELDQARYNLSQTRITAPFPGRVTERAINLGETVSSGQACFRLLDFDPVLVRLYFPERELDRVRIGQPATLTLDAQPGHVFSARVALVNPVVDHSNGTFKVTLEAPNPGGLLRPGSFARVRLKTGSFADALLLPRRGLLNEDGEQFVFVARGDTVVRARVSVGAVEGDQAQILAGLVAGDRVVTIGQGGLKPGARIKVTTF